MKATGQESAMTGEMTAETIAETTAERTVEMIDPGEAVKVKEERATVTIGAEVMEAVAAVEEFSQMPATGAIGEGVKMGVVRKMMGKRRSKYLVR